MNYKGEFDFEVYNNRRGSTLSYSVRKTDEGWYISHIAINGDCASDGTPFFYTNFDQDYIIYPSNFGYYLDWIWRQLDSEEINNDEAQIKLQELADWVTCCEKNRPLWPGWNC